MKERLHCELYNAFSNDLKPLGYEPVGNPVVTCIGNCLPNEKVMVEISKEFGVPIICFLDCSDIDKREVTIRYFCGNGGEVNLCGHGTFGSTKAISERFHLQEDEVIQYTPHYEKYTYLKDELIRGVVGKNNYSIIFPKLTKEKVVDELTLTLVSQSLGIQKEYVDEMYMSSLDDLILVMNDIQTMRKIQPDFEKMIVLPEQLGLKELRTVMTTCPSDLDDYDFETRVFGPWIAADEDVACGSANCSVAHYWSERFQKENMRMFYPYHAVTEQCVGGVQELTILDEKYIKITSNATFREEYEIEFDEETYEIHKLAVQRG